MEQSALPSLTASFYSSTRSLSNQQQLQKEYSSLHQSWADHLSFSRILQTISHQERPVLPLDRINRRDKLDGYGPQQHTQYSKLVAIKPQPNKIPKSLLIKTPYVSHSKRESASSLSIEEDEESHAEEILKRTKRAVHKVLENKIIYKLLRKFVQDIVRTSSQSVTSYSNYFQASQFDPNEISSPPSLTKYPFKRKRAYFLDQELERLQGEWELNQPHPTRAIYTSSPTLLATASRRNSKKRYRMNYTSGKLQCSSITVMSKPFACALREANILQDKVMEVCGKQLVFDQRPHFEWLAREQALRKVKQQMLRDGVARVSLLWFFQDESYDKLEMDDFARPLILLPLLQYRIGRVQWLSLKGCFKDDQAGLMDFLNSILQKDDLVYLNLSDNAFSEPTLLIFLKVVTANPSISAIHLPNCKIRDFENTLLQEALQSRAWDELDLSLNPLTERSILKLAQILGALEVPIKNLNLSKIKMLDHVGLRVIEKCETVDRLKLNFCFKLTSHFLSRLGPILSNSLLKQLEMCPKQGLVDLISLSQALENSICLECLTVGSGLDVAEGQDLPCSNFVIV